MAARNAVAVVMVRGAAAGLRFLDALRKMARSGSH